MLTGAHVVIYSKDAQADRKFFGDIFGFSSVDAGHGWLIWGFRRRKWRRLPRDKAPT